MRLSQQEEMYLILIPTAAENELNLKWRVGRDLLEGLPGKIMKAKLEPVLIINNFVEGIPECITTQVIVCGAATLYHMEVWWKRGVSVSSLGWSTDLRIHILARF